MPQPRHVVVVVIHIRSCIGAAQAKVHNCPGHAVWLGVEVAGELL